MGSSDSLNRRPSKWFVLIAILLIGFALHVYDLTGTPPGISADEVFYYDDARLVLHGQFPVYFPNNYGHEPMFPYVLAGFLGLLGGHSFTLRYTAVFGGMLGVAICYSLAKRLFNQRVALVAMTLFATTFWSLFLTRVGLRAFTFPVMMMFSLYAFWRALQDRAWRWTIAAGVLNGLTMYTYVASRVFPGVIVGWLLILLIFNRRVLSRNLIRLSIFAGLALAVWLPLLIYSQQNRGIVNQRLYTMGGPYYEIRKGNFSGLLANVGAVAGMFTIQGDPEARYNPDSRPVFDPITGLFFYLGILVALRRFRQPPHSLLFVWSAATLLPTLLSPDAPAFLRAGGAIFPTFAFAGIGLDWLLSQAERRIPLVLTPIRLEIAGFSGVLVLTVLTSTVLFGPWHTSSQSMKTYASGLYFAARYLDRNPPPSSANVFVVARDAADVAQRMFKLQVTQPQSVRWTTSIVWPAKQSETWYLFDQSELPDDQVRRWLGAEPVQTELNNAGQPVLEIYRLPAQQPLPKPDIPVEAHFDHLSDLIGVTYSPQALRGQSVFVDLFWRVRPDLSFDPGDPPGARLRLQSDNGLLWAEDSGLMAFPPTQWQPNDVWVQHMQLDLPPNMPPQSLRPELSLITGQGMWPVLSGTTAIARTALALPAIEVTGRPTPLAPPVNPKAQFGDQLALLQANVAANATPGSPLFVGSTWQALHDLDRDYALQIQLLRPNNTQAAVVKQVLWANDYPTHKWRTGEQITSNDPITVPVDLEAGDYRVRIRVIDAAEQPLGSGDWVWVGGVQVSGRPHRFDPLPVGVQVDAQFGNVARLVGYQIDRTNARPGGTITLTLIWQALQSTSDSYKVFTHLYNAQNALVGQHDGPPAGGGAPTTSWITGEYIEDTHVLPLDPAASGKLQLGVGLYHADTLQRLSVRSGNAQSDELILTDIDLR
jgi:4-amino-4-deoxy-L-arabinose transferase-like glycosyltransferase